MQTTKTKTAAAKKETNSLNKNVVQFRKGFLNIKSSRADNRMLALTVNGELMQFGYVLSEDALKQLSSASKEDIVLFHDEVLHFLKTFTGSNKNYRPFWKGFPEQVIEKSEAELWAHQLVNYWTNGAYEPSEWTKERATAFEQPSYTTIKLGTESDFEKIFTDLVSVNQSLTQEDLNIIKWFVLSESVLRFPDQIPFKENLCTLAAMGLDVPVKTVTDVLRIAVGMSGGDISLPALPKKQVRASRYSTSMVENSKRNEFKFKKFSNADRRYILGLLEKTNCDASEAILKDGRWVRLGEILHPGQFARRYPKSAALFNKVRNEKVQSFYGKVNAAFNESFEKGLEVLSERPGEFMRRLDFLIRSSQDSQRNAVLKTLKSIASKVSNKVLFEAYTHFEKRVSEAPSRSIMIKGARKQTKLPILKALPINVVKTVKDAILEAVQSKFASLEPMGKVYVDEELKKIPLPTNMRSLNPSLKPTVRGSRIPWDNQEAKVIRAFLHFEKNRSGITIDLSVVMVGQKTAICDWRTHKIGADIVVHSGDSYGRVGACAEYFDIDVEKALKAGYRYALIQLHNYNRSPELNENNHFGVMERNFPKSNEVWMPSTIANCSLVTVKNITNCAIIDLSTGEYIMVDEDSESGWLNVASTLDFKEVENYIKLPALSVFDLLTWHVEARDGKLVKLESKADQAFKFEDFAQSYVETLKMMGV